MEDANKIKNIILNFIVPIACLGATAVLFFAVIYPSIKKIPQLQTDINNKTTTRNLLKDKITKLHRYSDFKAVLEENSGLVNRVMPVEENVPGLLDQVNQIANETGLDLNKLSYSITDIAAREEQTSGYSTIIVSLGAEGSYNQMVSFMKSIEGASRMVNISNYRFSSNGKDEGKLSFTFILSAPYLDVKSNAVVDDPLTLDITSNDFITFVNKIKGLRYFEQSGDLSKLDIEVTKEDDVTKVENSVESTPSEVTGTGGGL